MFIIKKFKNYLDKIQGDHLKILERPTEKAAQESGSVGQGFEFKLKLDLKIEDLC